MKEMILKYEEFIKANEKTASTRLVNYLFVKLPDDDIQYLNACEKILHTKIPDKYNIFTKCIQRNKALYQLKYMSYFEQMVNKYIHSWGECDVFCYRIINPMIEKYPVLYDQIYQWTNDTNPYIRRMALVSLLYSSQSFSVKVAFNIVSKTIDKLIGDENYYVQKAIGWLLKYSYVSYPNNTMEYLDQNALKISKIVFNYAMQKMTEADKNIVKSLKNNSLKAKMTL